jgi:Uma2 family endonuclease
MPAVEELRLSLDEFHSRYAGRKPYFEYWNGEAIQKSMPTKLHSLIQRILLDLLEALGYEVSHEIGLRLDPAWEPVPDVIAGETIGDPYPTEAFEVVIEILSPDDLFSQVLRKCVLYSRWNIRQIVVVDPQTRAIWKFEDGDLRATQTIANRGDRSLTAAQLWAALDARLTKTR